MQDLPSQVSRSEVMDVVSRLRVLEIVDLERDDDLRTFELDLNDVTTAHAGVGKVSFDLKKGLLEKQI